MTYDASDIKSWIREDLKFTEGRRETVKAGLLERRIPKKVKPEELHVNPDDEFTFPDIGPNDAIIENYSTLARRYFALKEPVYPEPLQVLKLKMGGYMILNGHHRWAGALKARVPTIRIVVSDS